MRLDAIDPLPELWGLWQRVQHGVAARDGLSGEVLDRFVELFVSYGLTAPLVEALDLARYTLAALVLGVALAGRLLRLHRYLAFPSPESGTWARCNTRVSYPMCLKRPERCMRQLESRETRVSAPLAVRAFIFSPAIAVKMSGVFTTKVLPNPQQSSSFSQSRSSNPPTLRSNSRGSYNAPSSRR